MRVRAGRPLVIDQCKLEMLEMRVSTLRALHRIDMLVPFVLSNTAVRVVAQGLFINDKGVISARNVS